MSKYQKRSIPVEAIQWDPFEMTKGEVLKHFGLEDDVIAYSYEYAGCLDIKTPRGTLLVQKGDYIVVEGKLDVYSENLFNTLHTRAEEGLRDE